MKGLRKTDAGKHRRVHRFLAAVLAVLLAVQTVTPYLQTEAETNAENAAHTSADVTDEMGQLSLSLGGAWYEDGDGRSALTDLEDGLDYSAIPASALPDEEDAVTAGFEIRYELTEDGDARIVRGGDYFLVELPDWMDDISLTEDAQEICGGAAVSLDGRTVKVTWKDSIEEETKICGSVGITFTLSENALADEKKETCLILQSQDGQENVCRILLPAKAAQEEGTTEESETETTEASSETAETTESLSGDGTEKNAEATTETTNGSSTKNAAETSEEITTENLAEDTEATTETAEGTSAEISSETTAEETTKEDTETATEEAVEGSTEEESSENSAEETNGAQEITAVAIAVSASSPLASSVRSIRRLLGAAAVAETDPVVTVKGSEKKTYTIRHIFYDGLGSHNLLTDEEIAEYMQMTYTVTETAADGTTTSSEGTLTGNNYAAFGLSAFPTITGAQSGTQNVYTVSLPTTVTTTTTDAEGNVVSTTTKNVEWSFTMKTGEDAYAPEGYLPAEEQETTSGSGSSGDSEDTGETEGGEKTYIYRKDAGFTFLLDVKDGTKTSETEPDYWEMFKSCIKLYSSETGSTSDDGVSLDIDENGTGTITIDGKEYTFTVTVADGEDGIPVVSISGLPQYKADGTEILYSVKCDSEKVKEDAESGDYYAPSYDNTAVSNFGSVTTQTYSGGTLELLLQGTTNYKATKYWLDDGEADTISARPEAILTLWRYVDDGTGNYKTAAQVYEKDESGTQVAYEQTLSGKGTEEDIELEAKNSSGTITLSQTGSDGTVTSIEAKTSNSVLPKYDQQGNPYVYFARESLSGGTNTYEQVFLTKDGVTTDETSGKVTKITEDTSRESGDSSVYDGGILANRITDTESVRWKKVWNAGNYQTDLENVSIVLKLYYQGADGKWTSYTDSSGNPVTTTVSGFTPETLISAGYKEMPKYDKLGQEYTWKWMETDIEYNKTSLETFENGSDLTNITKITKGDGTKGDTTGTGQVKDATGAVTGFRLPHNVANSGANSENGTDVEYYTAVSTVDGDITTINNTLVGTTDYTVDKLWAETTTDTDGKTVAKRDENGNVIYSKNAPIGASVTVNLMVNGVKSTDSKYIVTMTENDITGGTENSTTDVTEYAAGEEWSYTFKNLDKYDESGYRITYLGKENDFQPDTWNSSVAYNVTEADGDFWNMQIKNTPEPGNPTIEIQKDWRDAGDTSRRGDVLVGIYASPKDGNTGSAYLVKTVWLTQGNEWYIETGLNEQDGTTAMTSGELEKWDIYVRELAIRCGGEDGTVYYSTLTDLDTENGEGSGSDAVTENTAKTTVYTAPTDCEVDADGNLTDPDSGSATVDTVTTEYQNYEISYSMDDGEYLIHNRRVGVMQVEASKIWVDDNDEKKTREKINATIAIVSDNADGYSDNAVVITGEDAAKGTDEYSASCDAAKSYALVNGVLKNSADSGTNSQGRKIQNNTGADAAARQTVKGEPNTSGTDGTKTEAYYFYNLPKYDSQGRVLHYTISEDIEGKDGSTNEYISEIKTISTENVGSGTESPAASVTTQKVNAVNTLSATKDVTFYKTWKDAYNYENNHRPDIYITLYKRVANYDEDGNKTYTYEEVSPYINRKWTPTENTGDDTGESAGTSTDNYHWQWTFTDLPKYDTYGEEIIYYAVEGYDAAKMLSLDYKNVELDVASGSTEGIVTLVSDDTVSNSSENASGDTSGTGSGDTTETETTKVSKKTVKISAASTDISLLPEEGTFTNSIEDTVTVQGKKVWKNIPSGTAPEDLPSLTIEVWRTTDSSVAAKETGYESDSTRVAIITPGTGNSSDEKNNYSTVCTLNNYTFEFYVLHSTTTDDEGNLTTTDSGNALPQYDADGKMFYYFVRETVTDGDTLENTAYEKLPGEVNNYIITNTYDTSDTAKNVKGSITVNKNWDGFDALSGLDSFQYPKTTYTLYRQYETNATDANSYELDTDGTTKLTKPEKVATKTIAKASVTTSEIGSNTVTSDDTITFDGLLLYAPNGKPYRYYVVETQEKGYTIKYTTTVQTSTGTENEGTGETSTESGTSATSAKILLVESAANTHTATVTYTNTYTPEKVVLNGGKDWSDLGNLSGTRPDKDTFFQSLRLYRYADAQSDVEEGGADAISYQEIQLVLTKSDDSTLTAGSGSTTATFAWNANSKDTEENEETDTTAASWNFTISGLPRYAPNGTEWKYRLMGGSTTLSIDETTGKVSHNWPSSSDIWNYKGNTTGTDSSWSEGTATTTIDGTTGEKTTTLTLTHLSNSMTKSASVTKTWANTASIHPSSVTVKLQFKVGDTAIWTDATVNNLKKNGIINNNSLSGTDLASALDETGLSFLYPVGGTENITAEIKIQMDQSSTKTYTLDNLPAYVATTTTSTDTSGDTTTAKTNQPIQWRFVETKAGDATVDVEKGTTDDTGKITYPVTSDGYQPTQTYTASTDKANGDNASAYGTDQTDITNTQTQTTSLIVTKKWDDDSNAYGTRTLSSDEKKWEVTVRLQYATKTKDANTDEETVNNDWTDVTDISGNFVTETITGDLTAGSGTLNEASVTFKNLPTHRTTGTGDTTTEVVYRAVEVDASHTLQESGYNTIAADNIAAFTNENSEDSTNTGILVGTGTSDTEADTASGTAAGTTITNTLTPTISLTATKTWKNVDSSDELPVIALEVMKVETSKLGTSGTNSTVDESDLIPFTADRNLAVSERNATKILKLNKTKTNSTSADTNSQITESVTFTGLPQLTGYTYVVVEHPVTLDENGNVTKVDYTSTTITGYYQESMSLTVAGTDGSTTPYAVAVAASADTSGTGSTENGTVAQTAALTNTRMEFTFKKINNETEKEIADSDLKLTVYEYDQSKTNGQGSEVFTWGYAPKKDASGNTYSLTNTSTDAKYTELRIKENGEIHGLPAGTYLVEETGTPSGYLTVESFLLTIDENGTVSVSAMDAAGSGTSSKEPSNVSRTIDTDATGEKTQLICVTDTVIRANVTLSKIAAETMGALDGAEFALQKKTGDDTYVTCLTGLYTGKTYIFADKSEETNQTAQEKTAASSEENAEPTGKLTLENLPAGIYRMVEITPKDGYSLTDPTKETAVASADFTVDKEKYDQTIPLIYSEEQEAFANAQTKLTIKKCGTDGQTLSGAEFTLTGSKLLTTENCKPTENADGTYTATLEAGTDGLTLTGALTAGVTYTLTETKAPDGYECIADPLLFSVGEDGKITLQNAVTGYTMEPGYFANTLTAEDTPIEVKLKKTDRAGNALSGAKFTLTGLFAGETAETSLALDDTNFETALTAKLIDSSEEKIYVYRLHEETAPEGYELMDDISFTVSAGGEIVFTDENGAALTEAPEAASASEAADGTAILTVMDEPIEVCFTKRLDGDTVTTGMEGAKFTITGERLLSSGDFRPTQNADGTWTGEIATDASGSVSLSGVLMPNVTYTLTETEAPEGAMAVNDETASAFVFTFTVDEKGVVTIGNGGEASGPHLSYQEAEEQITVWDVPTALAVYKKGMDTEGTSEDNLLEECSFAITGRFVQARYGTAETETLDETGTGTIELTTNGKDSSENALKGRLIVGETYTIREINPPRGYELGAEVKFTVTGTAMVNGVMRLVIELADGDAKNYAVVTDEDGNPAILQRDLPVQMKLKKAGEDGTALSGATFEITGIFGTDEAETTRTVTSGQDGCVDLTGLVNENNTVTGTGEEFIYRLTETEAPAGYDKLGGTVYFRLISEEQEDGMRASKIEILDGDGQTASDVKQYVSAAADASDADVWILTVTDPKTKEKATAEDENRIGGTTEEKTETSSVKKTSGSKTSSTSGTDGGSSQPNTGDPADLFFWIALAVAAAFGLITQGFLTLRKRRGKSGGKRGA